MQEPIKRKVVIEHIYNNGMWQCEVISVFGLEHRTRLVELRAHSTELARDYISARPELELD